MGIKIPGFEKLENENRYTSSSF